MSYVNHKKLERVLTRGYYVNDLSTLYNGQGTIMCDKCSSRITTCCIHYKDLDLCLPCVDLIRVQQVAEEQRERQPSRRRVLDQLPFVTLMRTDNFEPPRLNPGMATRMRVGDISPGPVRLPHGVTTDMRINGLSPDVGLHSYMLAEDINPRIPRGQRNPQRGYRDVNDYFE